jgi:hypothetical protein
VLKVKIKFSACFFEIRLSLQEACSVFQVAVLKVVSKAACYSENCSKSLLGQVRWRKLTNDREEKPEQKF